MERRQETDAVYHQMMTKKELGQFWLKTPNKNKKLNVLKCLLYLYINSLFSSDDPSGGGL